MMSRFGYLLRKIEQAEFLNEPFRHVEIDAFFAEEDFNRLLDAPEVEIGRANDDRHLIQKLSGLSYEPIKFPGTASSIRDYLAWRDDPRRSHSNVDTCEGVGLTFRLDTPKAGGIVDELCGFFGSSEFQNCLLGKFGLNAEDLYPDIGLQKYLSGYEISPHPDVRRKALTYMINVNPGLASERQHFHTHYMRFIPGRAYVETYWNGNPQHDRCWVPWSWCETIKRQVRNNSIVLFSPSDNTLHAVKADYDHLPAQRTQFYGNLWYNRTDTTGKPVWHDFEIRPTPEQFARMSMKKKWRRFKQRVAGAWRSP